jgi:molecular chaperone GrpE
MTKKSTEKTKTDAKKSEKNEKKTAEKKLQDENHQLKEDLKNQKDKLIRFFADFDNYKKRVEKERNSSEFQLKKKYLLELLDIKEILLQALDDKDPKEGLRIILNQLEQFFKSENIKYIECIEHPFNHDIHHAVTIVETSDKDDNIIIEEVRKGYLVDNQVLRPAHVIVSKKKCEEELKDE